jgi:arylsulfatase A-like enzyme
MAALLGAFSCALAEAIVAVVHSRAAAGDAAMAVLATVGLLAPLGIGWGLFCGAAAALLPDGWRPSQVVPRVKVAFRAGPGAEERTALLLALSVGAGVYLLLARTLFWQVRWRSPEMGANALVMACGLAALVPAWVWASKWLGRLLARILRPVARTSWGARLVLVRHAQTVAAISWGAPLVGLLLFVAPFLGSVLVRGPLRSAKATAIAVSLAVGASGATLVMAPSFPAVGTILLESHGLARWALRGYWALSDRDGDGYSAILWGGDCDDADASVRPGAREILDNGKDEDCDGVDLTRAEVERILAASKPRQAPGKRPAEPPRSILLITVDALRPDHLSCYGYGRPTSPEIDAVAARGVRFERVYSPAAYTPQAVPSMLSGRFPSELKRIYGHYTIYLEGNEYFAERLRARGYHTAAVLSHFYFSPRFGFSRGFVEWDMSAVPQWDYRIEELSVDEGVTERALQWLARHARDEGPFLFWVHYFDPHSHFVPHPGYPSFGDRPADLYDGEIRFTDYQVGRLLRAFERLPAARRAVTIISSDHGEGLGDHGHQYHGKGLQDDQIRVPLIISYPDVTPGVRRHPVSLLDLAPTILDFAGLEPPSEMHGLSLRPFVEGALEPPPERPLLGDMPLAPKTPNVRSLVKGRYKLIQELSTNRVLLYDLLDDPGEIEPLLRPDLAGAMLRELNAYFSGVLKVVAPVVTGEKSIEDPF